MNSLSWLLLAANLADNLVSSAQYILFVSAFAALVMVLGIPLFSDDRMIPADTRTKIFAAARKLLWVPAVCIFIITVVPSSRTIYLIAASEIGEAANIQAEMSGLYQDLKAIISKAASEVPQ